MKTKKSNPKTKTSINSYVPYLAAFFVVLISIFLINSSFNNLEVKNALTENQNQLQELRNRGYNPDPVNIRKIDIKHRYVVSNVSYEVKSVYLTPDIADYGDSKMELGIGTENNFLVVEVDTADIRTQGTKRLAPVSKYLQLKYKGQTLKPVTLDNLMLGPRESSVQYLIYVVPVSASDFILTTGLSAKLKMTSLKFTDPDVEAMQGVLLVTQGYASEFPLE